MFAKTVCRPGATLTVVPVGLLTTLQYNSQGLLEKVYLGYQDTKEDITDKVYRSIFDNRLCPLNIPTVGGTTWVEGIFYTSKRFLDVEGLLPYCMNESFIDDIQKNPHDYMFYAGNATSLATKLSGSANIRTWLQLSKFTILPAILIPVDFDNSVLEHMLMSDKLFVFDLKLIAGAMLIDNLGARYLSNNIKQEVVSKSEKILSAEGFIQSQITTGSGTRFIHYSDTITYNIQKGTVLVTDANNTILKSEQSGNKKITPMPNVITCSICGNTFVAPRSGPVTCSDPGCASRLYPNIQHFLKTLDLPELSISMFKDNIKNHNIQVLADVLNLKKYEDTQIDCTLAKFIEACTPPTVCIDKNVFATIANKCFNNPDTFKFYLSNPIKLVDIPVNSIFMQRFKEWLGNEYVQLTILACLESPHINISAKSVAMFEGAPIFRGKKILITGVFSHGDMNTISAILNSYGAEVCYVYDDNVSAVLVGDMKTNIDGAAIQQARLHEKIIFEETEFFNKYEIDNDLSQLNLL